MFLCSRVMYRGSPGVAYRLPKLSSVLIFAERPDGLMCCVRCNEIWSENPKGMLHYRKVNSLQFAFDPARRHLPECSPFSKRAAERELAQKIPITAPSTSTKGVPKKSRGKQGPKRGKGLPDSILHSAPTLTNVSPSTPRSRKQATPKKLTKPIEKDLREALRVVQEDRKRA